MYKEMLKQYFKDIGTTQFHVHTVKSVPITLNNIDDISEEIAEQIYNSLKRIENGEAEEVNIDYLED